MPRTPDISRSPQGGSALHIGGSTRHPGLPAPSHGTDAALPHERDQSLGEVAPEPDPVMLQAKRDLDAGMVDTDMRATPGLDATLRDRLVPEPEPADGTTRAKAGGTKSGRRRRG